MTQQFAYVITFAYFYLHIYIFCVSHYREVQYFARRDQVSRGRLRELVAYES